MQTKSAGRVSIRVLPDSTRFKEDLQKSLERIERSVVAHIRAQLELTRESIEHLKQQLRDLKVKIPVIAEVSREQLHKLKDDIEDIKPEVHVALNTLLANARLRVLTRPRVVEIFPKINKAALLAVTAALARLSGTRVIGRIFREVGEWFADLDKTAPKLASIIAGIFTLSAGVLALGSNFLVLGGEIATSVGVLLAAPAAFIGAGIAIAVLVTAFQELPERIKAFEDSFHHLADVIQGRFWDKFTTPLEDLLNHLLPELEVHLGNVAENLGDVFGELASQIKQNVTVERLAEMMDNLNAAIVRAKDAVGPLVRAFTILGLTGARRLPTMTNKLVELSERFERFITRASESGELDQWIDRGIQAFKDFGRVIQGTYRVFKGLNKAAQAAGGAGLADLADSLQRMTDTINTPEFQKTLIEVFRGAHRAMENLSDGFKRFSEGLGDFGPNLERAMGTSGAVVAEILDRIGEIIGDPNFGRGLNDMLAGLHDGIIKLEPAMKPLARILGKLGDLIGTFLGGLGPTLSAVIIAIEPGINKLLDVLNPLVADLARDLPGIIESLTPAFNTLMDDVVIPLVVWIKDELLPNLVKIAREAGPELKDFFKELGKLWRDIKPIITYIVDKMGELIPQSQEAGDSTAGAFEKAGKAMEVLADPTKWGGIFEGIKGGWAVTEGNFGHDVGRVIENIGAAMDPGLRKISEQNQELSKGITDWISARFNETWSTISDWWNNTVIPGAREMFPTFFAVFEEGIPAWNTFWQNFGIAATPALTVLATMVGEKLQVVKDVIKTVTELGPAWDVFWQHFVVEPINNIAAFGAAVFLGIINAKENINNFTRDIKIAWDTFWQLLPGMVETAWTKVKQEIVKGVNAAVENVREFPQKAVDAIGDLSTRLFPAGAALIQGLADGISAGSGPIGGAIKGIMAVIDAQMPHSPAKEGVFSGKGWTPYRGKKIVTGLAQGMRSELGTVRDAATDVMKAADFRTREITRSFNEGVVQSDTSSAGGGMSVTFAGDVNGATPKQITDEINTKLRRASTMANLKRIKVSS